MISSATQINIDHDQNDVQACRRQKAGKVDDSMARALITVFGMQNDGRIHKEKARNVVEKLRLIHVEEEEEEYYRCNKSSSAVFDLPGDHDGHEEEVPVEEVLGGEEMDCLDCLVRHLQL